LIEFQKNRELQAYWASELIENQRVQIRFYEEIYYKKVYYSVFFEILNKRKDSGKVTLIQTGKIGLTGLLWAKKKIEEFSKYISDKKSGNTIMILVRWDDSRRRKAYERGLKSLGFRLIRMYGKETLAKKIG
jgi:hypothetical protein